MLLLIFGVLLCVFGIWSHRASALSYGEGLYGTCQYNTCSVSIASNGTVNLTMTKSTAYPTMCSVGSDTIVVSTRSSTGYTVALSVPASDTNLTGVGYSGTIPASSATVASPAALTANTWGYRVDAGTFGAGPTTPLAGGAIPSVTFAGVPVFATPSFVTSSNSPATDEETDVWYGVCVNIAAAADDVYENDIIYTASVN